MTHGILTVSCEEQNCTMIKMQFNHIAVPFHLRPSKGLVFFLKNNWESVLIEPILLDWGCYVNWDFLLLPTIMISLYSTSIGLLFDWVSYKPVILIEGESWHRKCVVWSRVKRMSICCQETPKAHSINLLCPVNVSHKTVCNVNASLMSRKHITTEHLWNGKSISYSRHYLRCNQLLSKRWCIEPYYYTQMPLG